MHDLLLQFLLEPEQLLFIEPRIEFIEAPATSTYHDVREVADIIVVEIINDLQRSS